MFNCNIEKKMSQSSSIYYRVKISHLIGQKTLCSQNSGLFAYYKNKWNLIGFTYTNDKQLFISLENMTVIEKINRLVSLSEKIIY